MSEPFGRFFLSNRDMECTLLTIILKKINRKLLLDSSYMCEGQEEEMKIVSGNCVSSKQISLSEASKILSKFVSADNGASQVTTSYLQRSSVAFSELNQLHKELKLRHSHKKKHKRQKTEETNDDSGKVLENPFLSFETNKRHK